MTSRALVTKAIFGRYLVDGQKIWTKYRRPNIASLFATRRAWVIVSMNANSLLLLENVQKAREKRRGETRARAVFRGEVRHELSLMKRQYKDLLRVIQRRHLKVS
jgi:hypothetical protein